MKRYPVLLLAFLLFGASSASANPTETGATGLLMVPTADTLDAGNICAGIWGNYGKPAKGAGQKSALIAPASLTLGLGSFWEAYGSYPNLLFNNDEESLGRGTVDLGMKLRLWGKRGSAFKIAGDFSVKRHMTADRSEEGKLREGLLDVGGRVIASLQNDRLGVHVYTGYVHPQAPKGEKYDNEIVMGGGIEYSPSARSKVTLEFTGSTGREPGKDGSSEGLLGFQYYLTPHLTFNSGFGMGITGQAPDWRLLFGFTTCQGVGTYVKTIPTLVRPVEPKKEAPQKQLKVKPISSLVVSSASFAPANPLEVQLVDTEKEDVVIKPYGQISIPAAEPKTAKVILPPLQAGVAEEPVVTKQAAAPAEKASGTGTATAQAPAPVPAPAVKQEAVSALFGLDVKGQRVDVAPKAASVVSESMTVYRKFRFPDVTFDSNQWALSEEGRRFISEVAEQIRNDNRWLYLRIDGHTDDVGSGRYNMDLSLSRAIAVGSYLVVNHGIAPDRIFIKGFGKTKPIADNTSTEGRKLNRRCEVLFLIPKANHENE